MNLISRLFGKKEAKKPLPSDKLNSHNSGNKVDVNKPLKNPRLKKMLKIYEGDRTDNNLNDVLQEIALNAHFLSVIDISEEPEQDGSGTIKFKKGTTIQFLMLSADNNKSFYPVFTDWSELGKWQAVKSPQTLILSFDDYAAMVMESENETGVVINPFNDNLVLTRQMIEHMKTQKDISTKGVHEQKITKETTVLLGDPKNYPTRLTNAITDHIKSIDTVHRLWLRLMQRGDEKSYLLIVDFSDDRRKTFDGIADAARSYLDGMYLDMIPYQEGFAKDAVENVKPFYQRKPE